MPTAHPPDEELPHRRHALVAGVALGIVVAGASLWLLIAQLADAGRVRHDLSSIPPRDLVPLLVIAIVTLFGDGPVLQALAPRLGWRRAFAIAQSALAIGNTVPAGESVATAAKYGMFRDAGLTAHETSAVLAADTFWVGAFRLGLPALGTLLAIGAGASSPWLLPVAAAALALLAAVIGGSIALIRSERGAVVIGRALGRVVARLRRRDRAATQGLWVARMHRFRGDVRELVSARWPWSLATMTVNSALLLAVFVASLRATGVDSGEVSILMAFLALSVGRLVGTVAQVPGGIGVADLGLAGVLAATTSAPHSGVVAGVLVFRVASWLPPTIVGLCCLGWLAVRRRRRLRRTGGAR